MAGQSSGLDVQTQSGRTTPRVGRGQPSPRIEHYDGEIPPALSPLDAFAAQGRLLARQLDQSMQGDRRMSRLPPQSVARSLSQPRNGYYYMRRRGHSPDPGCNLAVEEPKVRPQSQHPRLSGLSLSPGENEDGNGDSPATQQPPVSEKSNDYGFRRTESPEQDPTIRSERDSRFRNADDVPLRSASRQSVSRQSSADSAPPQISTTLAPSASSAPRSSPIPKPMHPESSDDDYTSSTAGSTFSKSRKMSSSSGVSMPMSPMVRSTPRSPSISSEASNSAHLSRPSLNFSRPLNRSSTSLSAPSPVISHDVSPPNNSSTSNGIQREHKPMPITVPEPEKSASLDEDNLSSAVSSSYVYSTYRLPRGRKLSRNSIIFAGLQTPHFEWSEPLFEAASTINSPTTPRPETPKEPPRSPLPEPPKSAVPRLGDGESSARDEEAPSLSHRQSFDHLPSREDSLKVRPGIQRSYSERDAEDAKSTSADSNSTVRPSNDLRPPASNDRPTTGSSVGGMTVEEHVEKGIECHEKGALQESTYHLRIAAKHNHPTGMLLYALACRHGWGMKPNQREGVQWLRKAVDSAGLELGDGNEETTSGKDAAEIRARRAQFALALYELGVSHLNGWGIEQDKALALRCFEIAGRWGDADALAEAGYCYAEGVGCKKDLKKAAKYYRMAAAKGISMVGNSWIYKDKYMSDDESNPPRGRQTTTPEKKPRSKSRTRSIFGRRK
ncbi:hypothetical protein VTN31DRAFT_3404 [Thermomyces dupontii]|uniref:uncharacterized protein n=1 Tax=Talaromyces thermophilus TaxID=28565 RepID=UPI003742F542